MKKILIAGSTGLLGASLIQHFNQKDYCVVGTGYKSKTAIMCDFTNEETVFQLLDNQNPDVIINLIALTNVDQCENNLQDSFLLNVKVAENIARWISHKSPSTTFMQISTDQVYDGAGPFFENDVNLSNIYAFSKYAGEWPARSVNGVILRTNFFGLSHCDNRQSFTDWLYHAIKNNIAINVFDDINFSPLSLTTLCQTIELLIEKRAIGTFNLGSHEGMSKADFAFSFAKNLKLATNSMTRTHSTDTPQLTAYRPKDMRMNISLIETTLSIKLPTLENEIRKVAEEYNETF